MRSSEIEIIADLEQKCFPNEFWSFQAVKSTLERADALYGIEYAENTAAGYYLSAAAFEQCELYRIAVLPMYRNKGIGSRLMENFLTEIKNKPEIKSVFLEVRSKNTPAVALYKKYGFKQIALRKNYYKDDDALIFKLDI